MDGSPFPISEPPPPVSQRLLIGACVPEWLSSPTMRRMGPPAAVSRRRAFWTGGAYTQFSRVAEPHAGGATGADDLVGRGERALEHRHARRPGVAEEAGEGLLDDDVLARARRLHRHRRMQMRRHAEVDHVDFGIVEDGVEITGDGGRRRPRRRRRGRARGAPRSLREGRPPPRGRAGTLRVEAGDEPRAHDSHPYSRLLASRHAPLPSRPMIDEAIRRWQGGQAVEKGPAARRRPRPGARRSAPTLAPGRAPTKQMAYGGRRWWRAQGGVPPMSLRLSRARRAHLALSLPRRAPRRRRPRQALSPRHDRRHARGGLIPAISGKPHPHDASSGRWAGRRSRR